MEGFIHSQESFGTVDGPGLRYVIFMQGCPMRCKYCHNPDTWALQGGTPITVEEILQNYQRNRTFYRNGGLTVTGGEPLMQIDFVLELFAAAKKQGIHTCIDTSGIVFNSRNPQFLEKLDALLKVTDLVMLDIKHIEEKHHKELTGQSNANILAFARYLAEKQVAVWIRHVVVPGYTDDKKYLHDLGYFIGGLSNVKALDVLPYHTMGKVKYEQMGIPYPLDGVPQETKEKALEAKEYILEGMREKRRENMK